MAMACGASAVTKSGDQTMTHAQRILAVIEVMKVDPAITDVLWMPNRGHVTVAEELADIASELGATDDEVEVAFQLQ